MTHSPTLSGSGPLFTSQEPMIHRVGQMPPSQSNGAIVGGQQPKGPSHLMHSAIWPVATLVLMMLSFAAGRMTGFRSLPEIVATLPGDELEFSRELDGRIRERFPVGTSEDKLLAYLDSEQFVPEWRRRDGANSSSFISNGLICQKVAHVRWRADPAGVLTEISGAYESHCL